MTLKILKSLFGRQFGITSTGGFVTNQDNGNVNRFVTISSDDAFVEKVGSYLETIAATGTQLVNYGISWISSDVVNGATLKIAAPAKGVRKEIFLDSSASTLSIGTTAAGITFGASVGSSVYNMDAAGGVRGTGIIMVGLSATRWGFIGRQKLGD